MAIEREAKIEIDTRMGKLIAELVNDPDYPGFDIILQRPDGTKYLFAVAEVEQGRHRQPPRLILRSYTPESDEPKWLQRTTETEIDAWAKGE